MLCFLGEAVLKLAEKTITVTAGRIINMSLPADGSSVPYSHTFTLQQPEGLEFIATMYDADGFGSGGASEVLCAFSLWWWCAVLRQGGVRVWR